MPKDELVKNDSDKDEPKTVGGFSPTTVAEEELGDDDKSPYDNIVGPIDPEAVLEEKAAGRPGRINEVVKVAATKKTITVPETEKLKSTPAVERRTSDEDPLAIVNDHMTHPVAESEDGAVLDAHPLHNIRSGSKAKGGK